MRASHTSHSHDGNGVQDLQMNLPGPSYRLTASLFGQYFHLSCELALRLSASPGPSKSQPSGHISRATLRGQPWETQVIEHLRRAGTPPWDLSRKDGLEALAAVLTMAADAGCFEVWVYQAEFTIPHAYVPKTLRDCGVSIGVLKPDFLRFRRDSTEDTTWRMTIIDAKASTTIKQSHQAQVGFYAHFLALLFSNRRDMHIEVDHLGGVWLQRPRYSVAESLEMFTLSPWLDLVAAELHSRFPSVFTADVEDVPWQLRPSCQGCGHVQACRVRGRTDVRGLPGLTKPELNFILKAVAGCAPGSPEASSVGALRETLPMMTEGMRKSVFTVLGATDADARDPASLPSVLRTMLDGEARLRGRPYGLFPRSDDEVAIHVVLCLDPLLGLPYAWALSVRIAEVYRVRKPRLAAALDALCGADGVATGVVVHTRDEVQLAREQTRCLAGLLQSFVDIFEIVSQAEEPPRTQVYVWDEAERAGLVTSIVQSLHEGVVSGGGGGVDVSKLEQLALLLLDVREAWDLQDPRQPAYEAQMRSEAEIGRMTVAELVAEGCVGTQDVKRGAKAAVQQSVKAEARRRNAELSSSVPAVCDVLSAYRVLLLLPFPGFTTSSDVAAWLQGRHQEAVYDAHIERATVEAEWASGADITSTIRARLSALEQAVVRLRAMVLTTGKASDVSDLLYNDSRPSVLGRQSPRLPHPLLQRLCFMKQVDTIVRCHNARWKRALAAAGCDTDALIVLSYTGKGENGASRSPYLFTFIQTSGPPLFEDSPSELRVRSHNWLLCAPGSHAVSYLDMDFLAQSHYKGPGRMTFAAIHQVGYGQDECPVVKLELAEPPRRVGDSGPYGPVDLYRDGGEGRSFWLFKRVVERSAQKVVKFLRSSACEGAHALGRMLDDPYAWDADGDEDGERPLAGVSRATITSRLARQTQMYNELVGLGVADPLLKPLRGRQKQAFDRLLGHRLTLVWGPPGTGKTHFAARSLLSLIEAVAGGRAADEPGLRVLVTAFTHTAIDNVLIKFKALLDLATCVTDRADLAWQSQCRVFKLVSTVNGDNGVGSAVALSANAENAVSSSHRFTVMGATVWRIHADVMLKKSSRLRSAFDVVLIDEASQMPVTDGLIPVSCLKPGGRLVVIGDSLQLPPIMALRFPRPLAGTPELQSSLLACLTRTQENGPLDLLSVAQGVVACPPTLIKLRENYRMNEQLNSFTARLYGRDYLPSLESSRRRGVWLVNPAALETLPMGPLLRSIVDDSGALPGLVSVRLVAYGAGGGQLSDDDITAVPEREQWMAEARVVAQLMSALAASRLGPRGPACDAIFAVTPHRRQKALVLSELSIQGEEEWGGAVDTVERMQGQERALVILCLGLFSLRRVMKERDFLFSPQRLNVAISRAQQSCVVVYTDAILTFNPDVVASPEASSAYSHLRAFVSESRRIDCPVVFNMVS